MIDQALTFQGSYCISTLQLEPAEVDQVRGCRYHLHGRLVLYSTPLSPRLSWYANETRHPTEPTNRKSASVGEVVHGVRGGRRRIATTSLFGRRHETRLAEGRRFLARMRRDDGLYCGSESDAYCIIKKLP